MSKKIGIVGAGVAGLAVAARLAKRGYQVEVFEKLAHPGGRNQILEDRGFKFDMGPSFVLMPDFFEEVFSDCGENLKDYLNLKVLDPSYKIFYPDGEALTVHLDSKKTKAELERIEQGASAGFDKFIAETAKIYNKVKPLLYQCFTPAALLNPRYWLLIKDLKVFETYWKLARRFFKSDKLCYAFTFEAMFIGVSPFSAPAFYSIITYTDHVQKIFHPMGGMYQIPLALEKMAKKFGANFHYNSEIKRIESRKNSIALKLESSEAEFDRVVVNADYPYAQEELLGRRIPDYQYSCSVYLLYLGLKRKIENLAHHNLFFSGDLKKNLAEIFQEKTAPSDPSFYVHVPTVTDPLLAPQGKSIFYILVPVANLKGNQEDIAGYETKLREGVFKKINSLLDINLEDLIEVEHRFYPQDFIGHYNIKYGATFSLAHNLRQSAFLRPANFDPKIKGLYYVGASTQPGGGLPVVIAGSKIVTDLIS